MASVRPGMVVLAIAAFAAFAFTGCVTAKKYRPAKKDTPPAARLDYTAKADSLELKLVTVIVYDGPGSWKREARWDEYVASLTNRGAEPMTIESAALVDLVGAEQVPGDDPWRLEALSATNWEKYSRVGKFVLGVGAGAGAMEAAAIGYGLAGGGLSGAFFIMPVILVADVATVAVMNQNNKLKAEREFGRRRLKLPLALAPGATVSGSWFFPMVPGPQRLIVRGRGGEQRIELALDLQPLAGLHLQPADKKSG